ncbi:MAG: hypothetical protein ITG02_03530 [Patulibacter sp.]|nr:hypothetical protein [Patulibacter sp.]
MAPKRAQRSRLWIVELDAFGYELVPQRQARMVRSHFTVKARRQLSCGPPGVTIEVTEQWAPVRIGQAPDARLPIREGFFPVTVSWHAQFDGAERFSGERAERLDVDPKKARADSSLLVHRHPLGHQNSDRRPADALPEPAVWIEHVEHLVYEQTSSPATDVSASQPDRA